MTATAFGTNDPRTQKKWSKKMFEYALNELWFLEYGLMGTGPNSIIQVAAELDGEHQSGDEITFELEEPLSGTGQGDDGDTTGNEESLVIDNMSMKIHERAHSVVSKGKMSEKRTSTVFRDAAKRGLGRWTREKMENDILASVYGLYNDSGIATVTELAPSTNRHLNIGQKADGTVATAKNTLALMSAETVANYLMGTKILQLMKRKAQLSTPKIRPIRVKGYPYPIYVVLLHPYQIKAIKAETGSAGYAAIQAAANKRGDMNPLFSGAEFLWDGLLAYEYDRAPMRAGAGGATPAEGFLLNAGKTATTDPLANGTYAARAVLLGAQAAVFGWGQRPAWYEEKKDARKPKVVTDMLYGCSKTRWNTYDADADTNTAGDDYGVITVDTMVVPD